MRSHWTSQSFSDHLHQANLSMLALRVVTARVLVVLSGSFTSQTEMGQHQRDSPIHKGCTIPIDESQLLTPNRPCLPWPGIELRLLVCQADVLNHYTLPASHTLRQASGINWENFYIERQTPIVIWSPTKSSRDWYLTTSYHKVGQKQNRCRLKLTNSELQWWNAWWTNMKLYTNLFVFCVNGGL